MMAERITKNVSFPELLFLTADAAARERDTNAFRRMRKILRDTVKRHALDKGYATIDCPNCRGLAAPVDYVDDLLGTSADRRFDKNLWICLECEYSWVGPEIHASRETRRNETPRPVLIDQIWKNLRVLYGPDVEKDADSAFQRFLEEETVEDDG